MRTVIPIRVSTRKQYGQTPSIIKAVQSNSAKAAYDFARRTQSSAKRRVHVITGNLKLSIVTEKVAYGRHRVVVGAYYGAYEEYGTRYRPPHPYLRPAVEENRRLFYQQMRRVFHR